MNPELQDLIDTAYARLRGAARDTGRSLKSPEILAWIRREAEVWDIAVPLQLKDLPLEFLEWLADMAEKKLEKRAKEAA